MLRRKVNQLTINQPDGWTRKVQLDRSSLTIGRDPDNNIVVDHPSVSRKHARLIVTAETVLIEDLGSSSGIWKGDRRLLPYQPEPFGAEQSIQLGQVQIHLMPKQEFYIALKSPPAIVGIFLTIAILMIILGGIALFLRGMYRLRERPVSFTCEQPPMRILSNGGDVYYTQGLQVLDQLKEEPSELTLETLTAPTLIPSSFPISQTETVLPAAISPTLTLTPSPQLTAIATQPLIQTTTAPGSPILSSAFLELPFPYQGCEEVFGGTDEQFRKAVQLARSGGRITSWFDHYLPIYKSEEQKQSAVGNVLLFNGLLLKNKENGYYYSGHPGYDFSPSKDCIYSTPVLAPADGIVTAVGKIRCGLYITLQHHIAGVGDFQTYYLHLKDDEYYQAMKNRVGQYIPAGTRIATIGNTGDPDCTTGPHLHFSVCFDRNQDGIFSYTERVDPFSYQPGRDFLQDPWVSISHIENHYLWKHPLGLVAEIPENGGGSLGLPGQTEGTGGGEEPENALCAEPGTLPPGGTIFWSWSPNPAPTHWTVPAGEGCGLFITDSQGNPVTRIDPPIKFGIPFNEVDLKNLNPDSLTIYWAESGSEFWEPLPTQIDQINHIAIAYTNRPGHCTLLANPTRDIVAPETRIEITGMTASDGVWYDQAIVSLSSEDPSGIDQIEYSLDGGITWQLYTAPFTLVVNAMSAPPVARPDIDELTGGILVLASAKDKVGNVEDPPAQYRVFIIASQTPTPTVTPTATPTPTPTEAVCNPILTVSQNAHCRKGPGTVYGIVRDLTPGINAQIEGQNNPGPNRWWYIKEPVGNRYCWISEIAVSVEGDTTCLPVIKAPPTPTPTPTPTLTLTPTKVTTTPTYYP